MVGKKWAEGVVRPGAALVAWLALAPGVAAQGEEIRIDGRLTEAAWQDAPAIREFVQGEPVEGASPGART